MKEIVEKLIKENITISTMESCTGGLLASSITDINGSSNIFGFGAVTYSNEAKIKLGVDEEVIKKYSVYSKEVAISMSEAITSYTNSDIGVGITGKLNAVDKTNMFGKDNEVFICITNKKNNKQIVKSTIVNNESKYKNKLEVIEIVKILLSNII